jgi:hypothetical protein
MTIPGLSNLSAVSVQQLLDAGLLTVQTIQKYAQAVVALIQGAISLEQFFATPEVQQVRQVLQSQHLLDHPATEDDLAGWTPSGDWLTDAEISQRVTDITQAVALGQWVSGFMMAVQLMMLAAGGGA